MFYVTIKRVGSHEIYSGTFGDPPIDPEESSKKFQELLNKDPLYIEVQKIVKLRDEKSSEMRKTSRECSLAIRANEHSLVDNLRKRYIIQGGEIVELDKKIARLNTEASTTWTELRNSCFVYQAPRNGKLMGVEACGELLLRIKSLKPGEFLTTEERIVTGVQLEKERIDGLSSVERKSERRIREIKILNESADMRSRFEIMGDEHALEKSKNFYAAKMDELEKLYGRIKDVP